MPVFLRTHYIVLKINMATLLSIGNCKVAIEIKPAKAHAAYQEIFFNKQVYCILKHVSQDK